ncbi:MAG TPA: TetR/AcrR family transcriptional regulator [Dongiaceae bacterium]|jgi:AcrR family transcriptional regulator|nr:TetR/AcrR family transcriptional regulator [Dongiaceae bacterium]
MARKNLKNPGGETVGKSPRAGAAKRKRPVAADRIKRTARDLFYREGIRAVGVDKIVSVAGVTKPSLYRSYPSKDELAVAYLRDYADYFWERFNGGATRHPEDARAQVLGYLRGLAERSQQKSYRGCGISNAAVEYPERDHPARAFAEEHKKELRARLAEMAKAMGARDPKQLGDGLLLLIEGSFLTGQLFGAAGPAASVVEIAERLIDASCKR